MLFYTLVITHLAVVATANKPPEAQAQVQDQGQKQSKAGISWPSQEKTSDPVAKFFGPESKLSWHWNWNKNYDKALENTTPGLKINADFVPTFFGAVDVGKNADLQAGYTTVMGFNEPDLQLAGVAEKQAATTAADLWSQIAALRTPTSGIKLVSPGVAGDLQWLKDFVAAVKPGEEPDYINVHVYDTNLEGLKRKVEDFHDAFGIDLYITEFAMHSFEGGEPPKDQQAVHDFMGQTTKWMDETEWIYRYAWFGATRSAENLHEVNPLNRLMDEQGELTALGHQYVGGGHK